MSNHDVVDVLLVEDNPDDAEFTLRALRKANVSLRIGHVDDGVAALEFLFGTGSYAWRSGNALPRLMLLDLKLPKVDGLMVVTRVKSDTRTRALPVVMLTSSREQRDIRDCYVAGANSYIVKPVEYADLIATLGDVVRYWLQVNVPPTP
jgi:two-component system, response regulator